jgi:lipopolysaccharide transport system ATP-binding protein
MDRDESTKSAAVTTIHPAPAIEARNIGKVFGEETREGLLGVFRRRGSQRAGPVTALRDVSLSLFPGQIYGVIGPNGAGKTTLLRILGRVLPPSAGRVEGRGRVAGLYGADQFIDGGQSGRENIYNQARLLGWKNSEIAPRLDDIVEFAGLQKFVDVKVARYSRGMQLRLNFSIAANLKPALLLLDDVLAVGDRAFQSDALVRLRELADSGAAIVIVSHDMDHVARLCNHVFLLRSGEIAASGPSQKVVPAYLSNLFMARSSDLGPRAENDTGRIFEIRLLDQVGEPIELMTDDKDLVVEVGYLIERPVSEARAGIGIYHEGKLLFLAENDFDARGINGPIWFNVRVPRELLTRRSYELNVSVRTKEGAAASLAKVAPAATFRVFGRRIGAAGRTASASEPVTGALFRAAYPWTVRPMTGA